MRIKSSKPPPMYMLTPPSELACEGVTHYGADYTAGRPARTS